MKTKTDKILCDLFFEKLGLKEIFDTPDLNFELVMFEKGEFISQPSLQQKYLLFAVEGEANIYDLSEDGRLIPRLGVKAGDTLGTIEFFSGQKPLYYVEAISSVTFLALDIAENKAKLDKDLKFLHFIIDDLTKKLQFVSRVELPTVNAKDKLLFYLQNETPDQSFKGMDYMAGKIGCSRRQLQRVVTELCREGKLEKGGRGEYRMVGM